MHMYEKNDAVLVVLGCGKSSTHLVVGDPQVRLLLRLLLLLQVLMVDLGESSKQQATILMHEYC